MNSFGSTSSMYGGQQYDRRYSRTAMDTGPPLTMSPQLLFVHQPTEFTFAQQLVDSKPIRRESPASFANVSLDPRRRESMSSTSSTPRRRESASRATSPVESKGSPAPSVGEQISQMSAAPFSNPFSNAFSGMFSAAALGAIAEANSGCEECLACGYRYGSVEELADHQRIDHGLAEVIF